MSTKEKKGHREHPESVHISPKTKKREPKGHREHPESVHRNKPSANGRKKPPIQWDKLDKAFRPNSFKHGMSVT